LFTDKSISYQAEASYWANQPATEQVEQVWVVFHGYGQLARFFAKRLDILDPDKNLIIAPQGLAKFYLDGRYDKVGACWLTKEQREEGIRNQWAYLNKVLEAETNGLDWSAVQLHYLGFSQGVATMLRWAFHWQKPFATMLIWAGGIPLELENLPNRFIPDQAKIWAVIGEEDPFYSAENFNQQILKAQRVFGREIQTKVFKGKHEVKREVLAEILGL